MDSVTKKILDGIAENHAKILDDFCRAYISFRWKDYFSRKGRIDMKRLELVHEIQGPKNIYYFRLKKGRLPSQSKQH